MLENLALKNVYRFYDSGCGVQWAGGGGRTRGGAAVGVYEWWYLI